MRVLARRDRFDRFVSVLVFVPRDRYDSDVRAARSATISPSVYKGRVSRLLSVLPGRAAGARAFHHRRATAARRRIPIAPTLEQAVAAIVRTWTDGLAEALDAGARAGQGAAARPRAIATPSPAGYREAYSPPTAVADIRMIESLSPIRPLGVDFYRARRRRRSLRRPEGLEPRAADPAVRARAGAGEHGLPGRRRAHLPDRAGRRRRGRGLAARHDAGARRRRSVRSRGAEGAARSLLHGGDARPRRERRLQRAGARPRACVARRRADAHDLALSCARSACPTRRTTCGRRCASIRRSPRRSSQLFHARFDPRLDVVDGRSAREQADGDRRRDRDRARARSRASTRTASCATSSTRCTSALRTNFYQLDDGRPAEADRSRSSSTAARSTACRCRSRSTRSSSIRRASRACICASARSRAAASAGPTGRRISAPRCSASSRRSRSRTP